MLHFIENIFEEFEKSLTDNQEEVAISCVGGGKILHEPEKKQIIVYSYSQVII